MAKIIIIRHGDSIWEQEGRYTGWSDVPIMAQREYLKHLGSLLLDQHFHIDIVFTSLLERSIVSAWEVLHNMYRSWVPEVHDWRLNPRHYGVIQGLTYQEALLKYPNIEEIKSSWDIRFEAVSIDDERHPSHDRRYAQIPSEQLIAGESLQDVCNRVDAMVNDTLMPLLAEGKDILIVAHHDSIKALVRHFTKLSNNDTLSVTIPLSHAIVLDYDNTTQAVTQSIIQ